MSSITLENIEDIDFWRTVAPTLNISGRSFNDNTDSLDFDTKEKEKLRRQIIVEGYIQTTPLLDRNDLHKLSQVVTDFDSQGIMPIFIALYDEFYQILCKLNNCFSSFLLDNYRLTPDFWVYHVPASDKERGWAPHRDSNMYFSSIRDDGTPTIANIWIPLTDVTTHNSCMYVLPRKNDLMFQDFARRRAGLPGIDKAGESPIPQQYVRALPVNAGELIGWDSNLLHWGSASSQWANEPRISIAVYYESVDAEFHIAYPYKAGQEAFIDYNASLGFEDRLHIIANSMQNYIRKFTVENESEKHLNKLIESFRDKWKTF